MIYTEAGMVPSVRVSIGVVTPPRRMENGEWENGEWRMRKKRSQ
jgi:hypothetical protein